MSIVSEFPSTYPERFYGVGIGTGGLAPFPVNPDPDLVTALVDRPAMTLAILKGRIGVGVTTYDTTLTRLLLMALEMGDSELHNWFTEDDTETGTQVSIPESIKVGIIAFVCAQWLYEEPANARLFSIVISMGRVSDSSVARERKGDVEIDYRGDSSGGPGGLGRTATGQIPGLVAAAPYWQLAGRKILVGL